MLTSPEMSDAIIQKPVRGARDCEVVQGSPVRSLANTRTAALTEAPHHETEVAAGLPLLPGAVQEDASNSPPGESMSAFVVRCAEETTSKNNANALSESSRRVTIVEGLADAAVAAAASNAVAAANLAALAAAAAQDMPAASVPEAKPGVNVAVAVGLAELAVAAANAGSATAEGLITAAASVAVEAAKARSTH